MKKPSDFNMIYRVPLTLKIVIDNHGTTQNMLCTSNAVKVNKSEFTFSFLTNNHKIISIFFHQVPTLRGPEKDDDIFKLFLTLLSNFKKYFQSFVKFYLPSENIRTLSKNLSRSLHMQKNEMDFLNIINLYQNVQFWA